MSRDPPAFDEPWQARAFALMLKLRESGHFTANEWSAALGRELRSTDPRENTQHVCVPGNDLPTPTPYAQSADYYQHWLSALESLVLSKGLTDHQSLLDRKQAWADAYRHTPHGKPVELG